MFLLLVFKQNTTFSFFVCLFVVSSLSVSIQEKSVQTVQSWWKTAGQTSYKGMPGLLGELVNAYSKKECVWELEISRSSLPPEWIAEQQATCVSHADIEKHPCLTLTQVY